MKLLYIILIIFAVHSLSFAQPSGYLGKRFALLFNQLSGPNYFNLIGLTNISGNGLKSQVSETNANINYNVAVSLDYVVGKTKSRGISISPINRTIYFEDYFKDYFVDSITGDSCYNTNNFFVNNAKLKGYTFGAFVKYYKSKSIAPLGEFYKIEILYSIFNINSFYKEGEVVRLGKTRIEPLSSIGFNVTYGKSRILWDKIVISTGISLGGTLNFFISSFTRYDSGSGSQEFNELKKAAHFWHGQNFFYNFYLGIGWLLF